MGVDTVYVEHRGPLETQPVLYIEHIKFYYLKISYATITVLLRAREEGWRLRVALFVPVKGALPRKHWRDRRLLYYR